MRRRVAVFFAVAWIFAIPRPLAHADEPLSLQDRYLRVYLKINEADQYERQGDYRSALQNFQDCYQQLERIHQTNPDWESALVVQRLRDCKREIDVLTDKAASQAPPAPPATEDTTQPAPSTPPSADVMTDDPDTLKKRLAEVEQELADLKVKYSNVELENKTLHASLDALNQQIAALKSQQPVEDQVGQLMAQNQDLNAKLLAAQKQITAMTSGPKSSSAMLRAQLKTAQDKLVESEAANAALQQTTTVLRQQLDQAQADLNASNQKLASSPPTSPEYETIKHENEVMRGILQREVQEQSRRDGAKRLAQEEFDRLKITSKVMQEQLDILGSPMTPPTNDEERALLTSLKDGSPSILPPDNGNVLTAPAAGTPGATDTNMASATPPATPDTTANPPPPTSTPAPTDTMPAPTNAMADSSTNPAPITVTPDTSTVPSAPATNATPAPSMASADTNVPPATAPDPAATMDKPVDPTVTTPVGAPPATSAATVPPPSPDNTPAPSGAAVTDPNAPPTETHLPPATTTVTETTIQPGGNPANAAPDAAPADTTPAQPPAAPPASATPIASRPRLPDDVRDTAQQASDLFKMQRYDEAAAKYQTIIDKYPDSLYAWSNLGVVRFQQGNLPEALKALQQAVKLSPTDAFSYSNLGIVYYQMNQYESAIEALERALALDPNDAKSHNYLGCACSQKGWQEVAEREFRKAIELDDTFADAHFNLALVYATSKPPSLELARRHYNRALELGIGKDARLEKLLAQ